MIVFNNRSLHVHKDIAFAPEHGKGIFRSHHALFRDSVLYRGNEGLIGFVFEQHVIDCRKQTTCNGNPRFFGSVPFLQLPVFGTGTGVSGERSTAVS